MTDVVRLARERTWDDLLDIYGRSQPQTIGRGYVYETMAAVAESDMLRHLERANRAIVEGKYVVAADRLDKAERAERRMVNFKRMGL